MERIDLENEMAMERKFLPNVDLAYDLYAKKTMGGLDYSFENKSGENFSSFINKAFSDGEFSSVFSVKNTDDFFSDIPDFYNPLRAVSSHWETKSDSVEIPSVLQISSGINNDETESESRSKMELIRMFPIFAKTEWPITFFNKVEANQTYFKSLLAMRVAAVERNVFVNGDGNNKPKGLLKSLEIIDATESGVTADALLEFKLGLNVQYSNNACFMMSSTMYSSILKLQDSQNRYIFEGKELFGSPVHILDELGDVVLFGNFKHGYLIADMQYAGGVRTHHLYDKPGSIGLTYSSFTGAGVIDSAAIKAIKLA